MKYPVLSRLFLSRFCDNGVPSIPLADSQREGIRLYKEKCKSGEYSFEEASCLCGESRSYCVGTGDRYGLAVGSHVCMRCGMMRTSPRLTEESLNAFYAELYGTIYEFAANQEVFDSALRLEQRFAEQRTRGEWLFGEVKDMLPQDRAPVVFDIGCNSGAALLAFKEGGCDCYGCDLGTQHFKRGRSQGLTLIEGDETALEQYGPADFVFLSHVMEHLPHPDVTFANLRRLLRTGGMLYIEVPGMLRIHRQPLGMMFSLQNAHLWHFTLGTLRECAAQSGFALTKGTQEVSAFFTKHEEETLHLRRPLLRPYLVLLYIFIVEILYRLHLLRPLQAAYFFVRRGARHMLKDIWTFLFHRR